MLHLLGMHGLGDNFYQRAVLREMGPIALTTPWPQLYADLPGVRCIRPVTRLRTQAKNAARKDLRWGKRPAVLPRRFGYDARDTILQSLLRAAGIKRDRVDFSGPPVAATPGRYVVVRPATVRTEWMAASRNPRPEYLCAAADAARAAGFEVVSVADLDGRHESAVLPLPTADRAYHRGELLIEQLLALVAGASGVIGGVGWLLPAAIAYRVPMLLLYGGCGHWHGPQRVLDPRLDTSLLVQAMPDSYCMCSDNAHDCDKTISDPGQHIERFVRLAEDRSAAVAA